MKLSEDKISHLAHLIANVLVRDPLMQIKNDSLFLRITKKVLTEFNRLDEEIDTVVRKRLESYSRKIPQGSREWDILYQKYFDEEIKKRW